MSVWLERFPSRHSLSESFNHSSVARLPVRQRAKTLEVGAELGIHSTFEDLRNQEYYCLEYRDHFAQSFDAFFG